MHFLWEGFVAQGSMTMTSYIEVTYMRADIFEI